MKNTETNDSFDLCAYLLGQAYCNMDSYDIEHWCIEDARGIVHDLGLFGIDADADEVYEIIAEFIAQDAAEAE